MKKIIEETYVTKDGLRFTNKKEAQAHEEMLKGKIFQSKDELIAFMKETETWKKWKKNLDVEEPGVIGLKDAVTTLTEELEEKYPAVYINKMDRQMNVFSVKANLEDVIWEHFESPAVIAYFNETSLVELSEERILRLYGKAFSENHSYGISDTLYEFTKYIEAIEIANGLA